MDSNRDQDSRTPAQWLDIDEETLRARISLATEMLLTSGMICTEDVRKGWYDNPDPTNEMQNLAVTLGLMVILNGVNGAPLDALVDARETPRLFHGAIEAMLTAVDVIRPEVDA